MTVKIYPHKKPGTRVVRQGGKTVRGVVSTQRGTVQAKASSTVRISMRSQVIRLGMGNEKLPKRINLRRRYRPAFEMIKGGMARELLHPLLPDLETYALTLSVIFGTYQRKGLLMRCIESIREAAKGIDYEVVVCDGGSTDGSRQWLAEQSDVVLIEGDLSGAVPAFNACFSRSRGRFILTLNDDARLRPDTLKTALPLFDDPTVGQVACTFLEHGKWKRQQVYGMTYVNFGFVRANVAKAVASICGGLWSTSFQTYGADVELSFWVRRLGYKIAESDAKVEHEEYVDDLRMKNLRTDKRRHQIFKRWSSPEMLHFRGPFPTVEGHQIEMLKRIELGESRSARIERLSRADPQPGHLPPTAPLRDERVVEMHIWTDDDPQASLAEAMQHLGSKGHHRIEWTKIADLYERGRRLVEACAQTQPTFVFLQLQGANIPVDAIKEIRRVVTDPSLVVSTWNGDIGYGQGPWRHMRDAWAYEIAPHVDLMLFTGTGQVEINRGRGMTNAAYLQIGYDTQRYFTGGTGASSAKQYDVVFLGQNYPDHLMDVPHEDVTGRRNVVAAFQQSGLRFGVFGPSWRGAGVQAQIGAGDTYRNSGLAISISMTSGLARYSSDRLLRSMACGCATLIKLFPDLEGWGLQHRKNCLVWNHPQEAVDLAREYLAKPDELAEIGRSGALLMRKHHTWRYRLTELSALLKAMRGYRE